jgi:uncharacterized membrane protein
VQFVGEDLQTVAHGDGSLIVEPRRFVVRTQAAFSAIWAAHAGPETTEPVVDFDLQMIAAVFAGERPTPGYDIRILELQRRADEWTLIVEERHPDPSLAFPQVIVSPFHIVSLPRHTGDIRFESADAPRVGLKDAAARSSTGLTPRVAATLAYLAGPFSGALVLATEHTSPFVKFHAWQSVLGLGALGLAAVLFLILAFVLLIASPLAFWIMLWLSAIAAGGWLVAWGTCVVQAYHGRRWKLPIAGHYADRYASQ